jgi:hypothetical protein
MSVRCAKCRAVHEEWAALPLVQRLGAGDTSGLMTSWPWHGHATIEARRCPCGAIVARSDAPSDALRPFRASLA